MKEKIEKFLKEYSLLNDKTTILVGFSGGYDSMSLLDVVYKLSCSYGFTLIAVHLNHNWRGEESEQEAQNCNEFCKKLNIEFYMEVLDKNEKHSETVARELRYKFFEKAINRYNADALLTAHTKSDVVETVVYRLIKGTGIKGLQGISPKLNKIYRPMLDISRSEIEDYCKANALEPNLDSSNNNNVYSRNFIRNKILQLFPKINKNYENSIYALANLAFEEERIVLEYIEKLDIYKDDYIISDKFIKLSEYVKKRIMYEIFVKYNIEYSQERVVNALKFADENIYSLSGKKFSLNANFELFVNNKMIKVLSLNSKKISEVVDIKSEGVYKIGDYIFKIEKCSENINKYPDDSEKKAFVEINEPLDFQLRTRMAGDRIKPLGFYGEMKLKKYLNSKKILQFEKDDIILFCKGSEILWVCGFGLSDKIKVVKKCTHVLTLYKVS